MRIETTSADERDRGLAAGAAALRRGQLVGLPLDTAYGIAADAFSPRGTQALREAKGRADLSIPVMVPKIATVSGIAEVDTAARRLMLDFWPGPLTLVLAAQPTLAWSLTDTSGRVAVRMPLHPVALDLLERTGPLGVVAALGPAPAGEPAPGEPITADTAFPDELADHLAVILDAGPLPVGPSSTVVDLSGAVPVLVRPGPLDLDDLLASCPGLVAPGVGPTPGGT
jgi:tRNA threonylcarbamoyl adenosine modification protein (Sua5/YciO/YrdC/YwlC family)